MRGKRCAQWRAPEKHLDRKLSDLSIFRIDGFLESGPTLADALLQYRHAILEPLVRLEQRKLRVLPRRYPRHLRAGVPSNPLEPRARSGVGEGGVTHEESAGAYVPPHTRRVLGHARADAEVAPEHVDGLRIGEVRVQCVERVPPQELQVRFQA